MAERGLKIADVYEDTGISKTTLMALSENTGKGVQFDTVDKLCN
ncbi:TPA: helix-turn-helix domain-containing protein, partial [Streptococcus pyogenes]